MKSINANTKIAYLIKGHPDAMEAIISIDSKFSKLRNPFLRKVLAGRTSIAMASKIAGCKVEDFFAKLQPLGFEIDSNTKVVVEEKKPLPAFITSLKKNQIIDLDVRGFLDEGKDPLSIILEKVKSIEAGEALKIINNFEPFPLIIMLQKQGFETYADNISDDLVETYFFKKSNDTSINVQPKAGASSGFEEILERFKDKIVTVDVRHLEMPQPMLTILGALETLAADQALFVYHKRIPVFLLPELAERKLDYRIQEVSEGEVQLLIFKN